MSVATSYQAWKATVKGLIGDGECVSLAVNNSGAYVEYLFPGVSWPNVIAPVVGARSVLNAANPAYFDVVENDHNNPNQVPPQGAIMIFDATPHDTPAPRSVNRFVNPDGHLGINDDDSADGNGFNLFQQNAPAFRQAPNTTHYAWNYRYCLGWLIPKLGVDPTPPPVPPQPVGKTIFLPPTTGPWHLYPEGGPYTYAAAKALLYPSQYGGITYKIEADRGNGIYTVTTEMFGRGDLYTRGSDIIIK